MADNVMDYQTMLADMESKKAALEQAIASLRAAIAAGALGQITDAANISITPPTGSLSFTGAAPVVSIPQGAFQGKSIVESIILYLTTVRKRCPTVEIIEGLRKGGIVTTSKTFGVVVGNTLRRLKAEGKLLLFDDGWGLPEWVPAGLRSRVAQQGKPKTGRTKANKRGKDSARLGLQDKIAKYFTEHRDMELSGQELARALDVNGHGIGLVAYQMIKKGLLGKTTSGKFRAPNKVTPITRAG